MALLTFREVSIRFVGPPVLEHVNLTVEPGERLCLIGRNGEGKSTLMRLVQEDLEPDKGDIVRFQGLTTARVPQDVPNDLAGEIFDMVASGLPGLGQLLADYHHVSHQMSVDGDDERLHRELDRLGHELEIRDGWQMQQRVETILSRMQLDADVEVATLSAGMKRRVLLAKAIVGQPDILLLDEPTNHLDIEAITWLEEFLLSYEGTLLFVTHDRVLLKRLATRILDLDRGQLTSWDCDYETYLKRKDAAMEAEAVQQAQFDKKLAQEEAWIRQGIKARRTRNEGRVRSLQKLRETRRDRREKPGQVRLQMQEAERSGRLVLRTKGLTFDYGDGPIVRDLSTMIMRGDKIGIIGPNGAGKTTLIRLLLGEVIPNAGTIKHGTELQVAYFDQLHAQLDDDKTAVENVGEGSESVEIGGVKKHVLGYLQDFLFSAEKARMPIKRFSGGERNRLLLAKLFTKPSNVLVLDEPTNDLDMETLELLEQRLMDYAGTVLVVSHDREFLNNVVTSTLVFEGEGAVKEYAGGYDDWLVQRANTQVAPVEPTQKAAKAKQPAEKKASGSGLKYQEKRELESLPARIEALESEQEALTEAMGEPEFYQQAQSVITGTTAKFESVRAELEATFERWEDLESKS